MKTNFSLGLRDSDHPERVIENLRPASRLGTTVYESVGAKKAWGLADGWRPVLVLPAGVIVTNGTSIGISNADGTDPQTLSSTLPGTVAGAVPTGPDSALVMCSGGSLRVQRNAGTWSATPTRRCYPAVRFQAATMGNREYTVGTRKLSEQFLGGTTLTAAGRAAVTSDLAAAYSSLASEAAADGLYSAPVLAWCRYYDEQGRLLHTTPPVAVRAEADFSPWVDAAVTDWEQVEGYTLSVPVYRLQVVFEAAECPEVARVEILTTPQLHPYRADGAGRIVTARDASPSLRISLPGYAAGVTGSDAPARMLRILGAAESMAVAALSVNRPFGGTAAVHTVPKAGDVAPEAEGKAVDSALRNIPAAPALQQVLLQAPHSFGASALADGGATIAWGGLRAVRFEGWSPAFFASGSSASGSWTAQAVVWFGPARGVVFQGTFEGEIPDDFGPVLTYPSPDATQMRLSVYDGTRVRSAVFPLSPDASGRRAVYVAPRLDRIVLPAVGAAMTVDVAPADVDYPCAVAFADSGAPLSLGRVRSLPMPVTALEPLLSADSAWEYGRCRFVAATQASLHSVAVQAGSVSLRQIAAQGVDAAAKLCRGDDGVYAALPGRVECVRPGKRLCAAVMEGSFDTLAWDSVHGELLAFSDEECRAWCPGSGGWYGRPEIAGLKAFSAGSGAWAVDTAACRVYDLENEETATMNIRVEAGLPRRPLKPAALCIRAGGWIEEARAEVLAGRAPVCTLDFSGHVRAPLCARLLWRRAENLRLVLTGASDGVAISEISILS